MRRRCAPKESANFLWSRLVVDATRFVEISFWVSSWKSTRREAQEWNWYRQLGGWGRFMTAQNSDKGKFYDIRCHFHEHAPRRMIMNERWRVNLFINPQLIWEWQVIPKQNSKCHLNSIPHPTSQEIIETNCDEFPGDEIQFNIIDHVDAWA